jgi:hypothetical protein
LPSISDILTLFHNNGHEVVCDVNPCILDLRVIVNQVVGNSPWMMFVLTTDGLIWILDTTAKDGISSSEYVFKASWLRPSHLILIKNQLNGLNFIQQYLDKILITDSNMPANLSQLFDWYLDLNEADKYLNTGLERFLVETQIDLIINNYVSRNDIISI